MATTIGTYGKLLVNNAGISGSSVGDELALGWEKLMATNATSVFLGATRDSQYLFDLGLYRRR